MPRYFFGAVNGNGLETDAVDSEHASYDTARKCMARVIADIAKDEITATPTADNVPFGLRVANTF